MNIARWLFGRRSHAPAAPSAEDDPADAPVILGDEPMDFTAPDGGNPRKEWYWRYKRAHFSSLVNPGQTKGLEIGALDLPLIEREEGRCDFADFHDEAWLRAACATMPGHSVEHVAPVTHVVRDGYDAVPRDYDWIAASHVIEHIPDVLGWLDMLAGHMKPGGVLFLTIPDKRYIFDLHRQETTFGQLIARHRAGLVRPSFEQVFDFRYYHAPGVQPGDIWRNRATAPPERDYGLALRDAQNAEIEYNDMHCSAFTPDSFRLIMSELEAHEVIPFRLDSVREPRWGANDFTAALIRSR